MKKDTKRLEKFLSDPIFITQKYVNLKQTAIGFRIGTENELWNRRAVIWDLIGAVVETGETSRQVIEEMIAEIESKETERKESAEREKTAKERRARAKE